MSIETCAAVAAAVAAGIAGAPRVVRRVNGNRRRPPRQDGE